jgi:hypothetical protein
MEISDRLSKLANYYHHEAERCARGRAYLGAAAMQVAALEALLHAMCFLYPIDVKRTTVYARMRFRRRRNKALDFKLYQLINIARELGWFPHKQVTWGGRRANLAGFAHEVRDLRNYVHPGKWAPENPKTTKFTRATYGVVTEVIEVARGWLLERVHDSLRRAIQQGKI